jgi:hypothetical protein
MDVRIGRRRDRRRRFGSGGLVMAACLASACGPGDRIRIGFPEDLVFPATLLVRSETESFAITYSGRNPCFTTDAAILEGELLFVSDFIPSTCAFSVDSCCRRTLADACSDPEIQSVRLESFQYQQGTWSSATNVGENHLCSDQ